MGRKGDWIETYTGIKFYPLDPRPEEVDIRDIAHALSLICRFNGHCKHFYSVAQHSINVIDAMKSGGVTNPESLLCGLLHDAAEAYLADISRPVKPFLQGYRNAEDKLQYLIYKAYGLEVTPHLSAIIHEFDDLVLHAEAMQLMKGDWVIPNNITVCTDPREPREMEKLFLRAFKVLTGVLP